MNDDVVIDLRKRMIDAALADTKANDEGRPAIEKVKLLSEVVEMMQKYVVPLHARVDIAVANALLPPRQPPTELQWRNP